MLNFLGFAKGWVVPKPPTFGIFHIAMLLVIIAGIVLVCIFMRKTSDKTMRIVLLVSGGVMLLLEVFRQIYNFTVEGPAHEGPGRFFWQWFPFQLCSIVMYFYIIAGFLEKDSWFKQAFLLFIASYGLFGGILSMAVPGAVIWNTNAGLIIMQTTIHHILMILVAVYLIVGNKLNLKRLNFNFLTKAFVVFCVSAAIAILINCIVIWSVGLGNSHNINMFFLNPYVPSAFELPLFGDMGLPYVVWLLIFIIGYSALCFGTLWAVRGFQLLAARKKTTTDPQAAPEATPEATRKKAAPQTARKTTPKK